MVDLEKQMALMQQRSEFMDQQVKQYERKLELKDSEYGETARTQIRYEQQVEDLERQVI
jgi:hypothetical protein